LRKKTVNKYIENPFDNSGNETRLSDVEARVTQLESQVSNNINTIGILTGLIGEAGVDATLALARIEALESETDSLLASIVVLQGNSISKIIDPCGDSSGFDEVLLKTGSGDLIAYFEVGNKRYLSVLGTGSYRTTDGSNCNFEVTTGGAVLHTVDGVLVTD
jgi:hypothetical protein